jgi:uncharacterized protein YdhG (YjbR/CyaY superfamily)
MPKSKSIVDQKLSTLAQPQKSVMLNQAQLIRNLIPGATECISYNLSAFEVQGGVFAESKATRNITLTFHLVAVF